MPKKLDALFDMLADADETFSRLPLRMKMEIEKISQGLSEYGPRKLHRRGTGTEFFEARDFRPEYDERRNINARLSARAGKKIVVEREAEIRQHVYLWRDGSGSMDYASDQAGYTKKQASEIMLLAFAKHLAKNEEMIGVLDRKGMYRGGKAVEWLAGPLLDVTIVTGDKPVIGRKLPRNSTAVIFSDFFKDKEQLMRDLDQINGLELKGHLVMVLDPQEVDFSFKGHVEFKGMEGEGKEAFKKAEAMQSAYQQKLKDHVEMVRKLCKAKGFNFIVQRTDRPLHEALLGLYGMTPGAPEHALVRGRKPGV